MNQDNTQKLYTDFDHLFRDRHKSKQESSMCWGFQCGDGWFPLVYEIAQMITDYVKLYPEADCATFQVKEKFGGLRFYINGGDETLRRAIMNMCQKSLAICELCSAPATSRQSHTGAVRTLCDACNPAWQASFSTSAQRLI